MDVAACFEALAGGSMLGTALARLGGLARLTPAQASRLACLAFLHDVGKANAGFQLQEQWPGGKVGHVGPLAPILGGDRGHEWFWDALQFEEFLTWDAVGGRAVSCLLLASFSHHGTPLDLFDTGKAIPEAVWEPRGNIDPRAAVAELGALCRRWFPRAFSDDTDPPLPDAPAFQHGFAGLCILADWLGSDTRFFFPHVADLDLEYAATARAQARDAIAAVGLDVAAQRGAFSAPSGYADLFEFASPNAIQRAVADLPIEAPLVILESETGSGKTEAALWHFARLYAAGRVDGLYFALPTRSAAVQLHDRLGKMVARMFPVESRPETLLAVPGYLWAGEAKGTPLPGFEVLWDDAPDASLRARRWAAENGKRYLAAQIAVGTVDQAMLAAMAVKHAHLRAACLSRSLLVIDEVHASDVYMRTILKHLIEGHRAAGGPALLLSATLGAALRHDLLLGRRAAVPDLATAEDAPYPALSWPSDAGGGDAMACGDNGRPKAVAVSILPALGDPERIAAEAIAAARAGARVLVVRNTVDDAIAAQRALEIQAGSEANRLLFRLGDVPTLHHGRFAPGDRKKLDRAVEARFGKHRRDGDTAGLVLIGTQTLEQSLDIDADLLITDLCPIDVLLQRIGRLHRHDRPRPAGFETPRGRIVVPEDRDLARHLVKRKDGAGLGTVYEDVLMLEAAWRLIEARPHWNIPTDNRLLVERGTHPEALASLKNSLGQSWIDHWETLIGQQIEHQRFAKSNLLHRDVSFTNKKIKFPPEEEERIRTRLGDEGPRAEFDPAPKGPFGGTVPVLPLPAHLTRAAREATAPEDVTPLPGGGFAFAWGPLKFRYDRLGLRLKETAADV